MTDPTDERWANPATMLGLLQRGRGAGYLEALSHREAGAEMVIECVANDPRWDHQVEERAWFYAALVMELGIDLSALRVTFEGPPNATGDDAAWLATEVFKLCGLRGVPGGYTELLRYFHSGRDREQALFRILALAGRPEAVGLLDEVSDVVIAEHLRDLWWRIDDFNLPPWPVWRRASQAIDGAIEELTAQVVP